MSLDLVGVNWIAVIVAAVAGAVVGFVWYAPPVFGSRWARASGIELPEQGEIQPIIGAVVTVLVTAYVLALLSRGLGAATLVDGAIVGVLVWLGFVATWLATGVFFERARPNGGRSTPARPSFRWRSWARSSATWAEVSARSDREAVERHLPDGPQHLMGSRLLA